MRNAADYLAHIKALIIMNPQVGHWSIVREENLDDMGLFRYRLTLRDGTLVEMFERFQIVAGLLNISKYSFHWQGTDGKLLKRWDNAAHHPEIETFPHHIHDGSEDNVRPHHSITAESFLAIITTVPEAHSRELGEEE
jgi:hypothetical protein